MPRIPDIELERLKAEVLVERLIEARGVVLKKRGADLVGLCPFHEDREPSLVVTPSKNLWHCFGCGLGGGAIDWVMKSEGVSFRHAVERLKEGLPIFAAVPVGATGEDRSQALPARPIKRSTVRTLDSPVSLDADDRALLHQVIDYYHATLKDSPDALAYLEQRGIGSLEAIETFKLGYADRTLGLRLPEKTRKAGAEVRGRLVKLGLYRESGHEHFNGSLIVPIFDEAGQVVEVYGRKRRDDLRPGTPQHLYLPGPHRGVWNLPALQASAEIILCEALIDALTFWVAGYRNVTASYGVNGFTDEHLSAFQRHGIQRVLIAYDRDTAGDRAAEALAERLQAAGMDCYRIRFPHGLDANDYARQSASPHDSLGALIRSAEWLGKGKAVAMIAPPEAAKGEPVSEPTPSSCADAAPLAAPLAASVLPPPPIAGPTVTADGDDLHLTLGDRHYRVRGLDEKAPPGAFKVNLLARCGEGFHADSLDLYSARQRSAFAEAAALELNVSAEVLRRDLGRLLLALEAVQDERRATLKAASSKDAATGDGRNLPPPLTEAEREAARSFLQSPDLLARITEDLARCGLVGEPVNGLVGYLACLSRKLPAPLAVLVQSASAAGKSALQDACLAFVPEGERVKYSAVTGQSLFYVGETDLRHKVLAIAESEGALQAAYALKLLQSEGELTIASTAKDPQTGQLATRTYRVQGPVMLLLTTTAAEPDEELLNRCLVLAVNESRDQTKAIHAAQRQRRTLEGLLAGQAREAILTLHRNAQRLLEPIPIVNPHAQRLTFVDG
ncbi:MAG TPA: CHC2 zinc finger domain-containing protein, partial [Candidatus Competibacter sp.]|nr:CHC2 zinc finger domain-containing protein [Candidatus Competibacter sp.]